MKNKINTVIWISLIINVLLSVLKLYYGFKGNAGSLKSDGFNSLSDVFVSIMILITLKIAHKKPDENHPYGHEKFEGLMYFLLGLVLVLTAFSIGANGISELYDYFIHKRVFIKPSTSTIYVAVIAILLKLLLSYLTITASKKYKAPALKADSVNHLTDVFATTASLIGITLAQFNLIYFDSIASILIALLILLSSVEILKEAISFLVDASAEKEVVSNINKTIKTVLGVIRVDDLKVRKHMKHYYVDVEICVDERLSLKEAHDIAENVHDTIEETYLDVLHCMVHVNPGVPKKKK
ncbi:MAG TPA: cation transporter [Acholeplasmataceae bacterium]|nr:cation transporter [Acholeplasmataceae bacterium]